MKIVEEVSLLNAGDFSTSKDWKDLREGIHTAVKAVEWPKGSGKFTIYPGSDKKDLQGNGVKPIKDGLIAQLKGEGWKPEGAAKTAEGFVLGGFDAALETKHGTVVLEWETGNISSSHRSLNKMAMLVSTGAIAAGILVVPSRAFYKFLTDRIGNIAELEPYFPFWRSIPCTKGILEIIVIEHDATSEKVPRIPKGTDGLSAAGKEAVKRMIAKKRARR